VAAAEERVREARALLAAGVDCSGLDERGRSALLEAATGGLTAILDLLLASGAGCA
jgi:ankyrin repeat protein